MVRADSRVSGFPAGINSKATGRSSTAEGESTTASGAYSFAAGNLSEASGERAVAIGYGTRATGTDSIAGGYLSEATAPAARAYGLWCYAVAAQAVAEGERARADHFGQHARAGGMFATAGDAQASALVARRVTTDATVTPLTFDGRSVVESTGTYRNVLYLPLSRVIKVRIDVAARRTDVAGEAAGRTWEGVVARDGSGEPRVVGTPVTSGWNDTAAAAWALGVGFGAVLDHRYLDVTVTGEAGKTIRWVAAFEIVESG